MSEKKILNKQLSIAAIAFSSVISTLLVLMDILPVEFGVLLVITTISSTMIASQITVKQSEKQIKGYISNGQCFIEIKNYNETDIETINVEERGNLTIKLTSPVVLPAKFAKDIANDSDNSKTYTQLTLKSNATLFNAKIKKFQNLGNDKVQWRIEILGVENDNLVIGSIDRN